MVMWKALSEYIFERLSSGQNVNIKGFGAFAFEIKTELPKIATKSISPYENIGEQRTL